jgi:hypothetical protein
LIFFVSTNFVIFSNNCFFEVFFFPSVNSTTFAKLPYPPQSLTNFLFS